MVTQEEILMCAGHVGLYCTELERLLVNTKKRGVGNFTVPYLNGRLASAKETLAKIQTNHVTITNHLTEKDLQQFNYTTQNTYERAMTAYLTTEEYILEQIENLSGEQVAPVTAGQTHAPSLKLPKLDLPKFSGDYSEWSTFYDSFKSMIHDNSTLPGVQKFHYLKACLHGEASSVIRSLAASNDSYLTAWNALVIRYTNERIITSNLLSKLTLIPKVFSDNLISIKTLRDTTIVVLDSLRTLGYPVDGWSAILVHILSNKLDQILSVEWEKEIKRVLKYPSFTQFLEFITEQINMLESISNKFKGSKQNTDKTSRPKSLKSLNAIVDKPKCFYCDADHPLYQCNSFIALNPQARCKAAQNNSLCINCLRPGHSISSCRSNSRCKKCSKAHHTLLHFEKQSNPTSQRNPSQANAPTSLQTIDQPSTSVVAHVSAMDERTALLATFLARATAPNGRQIMIRGLVDPGSQTSFMTENLAQLLRVTRRKVNATIYGVTGGAVRNVSSKAELILQSVKHDQASLKVTALILPKITNYSPRSYSPLEFPQLGSLDLADEYASARNTIDILIGADYCPQLLLNQIIHSSNRALIAQDSLFGWVVYGTLASPTHTATVNVLHCCDFDKTLRDFWEIEEVPSTYSLTPEDQLCEDIFASNVTQLPSGRYQVALPFKTESSKSALGASRSIAESALKRVLCRINKSPEQSESYTKFIREYEQLGHMEKVTTNAIDADSLVYLPHHAVFKLENGKQKIRVVFNASAKTKSGLSLNDVLLVGPKLQKDITAILMNWRDFRFVGVTDIVKMFRQILIRPEDRKFQAIIWKDDSGNTQIYQLNTVTYGTGPAPFLASRVVQELANQHGNDFPDAKSTLLHSIYVDDILFGANNLADLRNIQSQLVQLLDKGKFELSKWAFNSASSALQEISNDSSNANLNFSSESLNETSKVLGISWNTSSDSFQFIISPSSITKLTKRMLLSENAKIYDPLGWISPFTIVLKQIMQSTWLLKLNWDDEVPEPIQSKWMSYYSQMCELTKITIPRWNGQLSEADKLELYGFCDASNVSYSAVVYAKFTNNNNSQTSVSLVMAKAKVAPLKAISIARLELVAAAYLTKLMLHIKSSLKHSVHDIFCFSDSQIVLAWIAQHSSKWKVFVANRVEYIQSSLPEAHWSYVNTKSNPADLNSRGIPPSQLIHSALWWKGPSIIREMSSGNSPLMFETNEEIKTSSIYSNHVTRDLPSFLCNYSSWTKLIRVVSYVLRFMDRARRKNVCQHAHVSALELRTATLRVVKIIQAAAFLTDILTLQGKKSIPSNSRLLSLAPFLDVQGVLRVGGRLQHSFLSDNQKHPIILPTNYLTELLIRHIHITTLHGGLQLTLTVLRQKYWVINARNAAKSIIHRCVTCVRQRAKLGTQFMGSLPTARVNRSHPFEHTGIDYAGPFLVKLHQGRNSKTVKCYIAVFVCMATRAIHLELVSKYDTDAFLAALARFTSRRGKPAVIYSDNGLNFQGANKELKLAFQGSLKHAQSIDFEPIREIEWKFIPVATPHWGGLWESGVRSVKHHLKRILGTFLPTFEEMTTLICRIEACLNSRPLSRLRDDIESLECLTPGHFLVGRALLAPPEMSVLDLKESTLNRWQKITRITELFWQKWSGEYLQSLQSRPKWQIRNNDFREGDIVIIKTPNAPPCKWNLGRITRLIIGSDSVARVAVVQTANKQIQRSLTQLCRLPA
ncbi:uncharacterized protein [Prorops nasuta]|uniref:uncharacterized protein n=1 Tax=Prorops nasuta TaxID=863751 RepID=UPI0034CD531F